MNVQCSQLDGLGLHGLETGGMDLGGDKVVHGVEVRPEAGDVPIPMKLKREAMGVEMVLKQTAEIGMVLVGMAALRGGAPPAPVEPHLAIKAYSNLEGLAECVAPHDIVSKKSLQSLLQQLILPKNSILPTVSSLTPARDVSTPAILASAAPISAEAVNISGELFIHLRSSLGRDQVTPMLLQNQSVQVNRVSSKPLSLAQKTLKVYRLEMEIC